jgi:two-component system chemotaxis response regulator CheB
LTRIRVLVIDDSAFARKVLRQVLARSPLIEVVGIAHDGLDAIERVVELQPDVVTLDLMMPELDGLGFLQALRSLNLPRPPRVVVVSMSDTNGDLAMSALREGAVELVQKPTALANDRLYELSDELIRKVEAAAGARSMAARSPSAIPGPLARASEARHRLILIGASTGGPQAVNLLLRSLPADFPVPIAVVVHMPVGFSQSLAQHLDRDCAISVVEATEGHVLRAGQALLAQAGRHLGFVYEQGSFLAKLTLTPYDGLHRPSLDVTFQSAAAASPGPVMAIVLTGMGRDGLLGAEAVHRHGGTVLTQDEPSSVVYGMPRVVWEAGLAKAEADIAAMPALLAQYL